MDTVANLLPVDPRVRFPGPQPVALSRSNLHLLLDGNRSFLVGRKTDGVRVVLFLSKDSSARPTLFYLDRKLQTTEVFNSSPCWATSLFEGTILDAELSQDKFVVFDCYAFAGRACWDRNLIVRLGFANQAVQLCDPHLVQLKTMVPLSRLREFASSQDTDGHPSDGFIFTPVQDRVTFKSALTTLKFKEPQDHTCDFLVREPTERSQRKYGRSFCPVDGATPMSVELWFTADRLRLFAVVPWTLPEAPEFDRIWEFRVCADTWQPVRLRADKRIPNFKTTVLDTLRCLEDGVRLEELL